MAHVPLAAVLPWTPATVIVVPVVQLCAGETVIWIGAALDAPVTTAPSGVAFIEHIVLMPSPPLPTMVA